MWINCDAEVQKEGLSQLIGSKVPIAESAITHLENQVNSALNIGQKFWRYNKPCSDKQNPLSNLTGNTINT